MHKYQCPIRRDFFICWITLSADLENCHFNKKKKKGFCLRPLEKYLFLVSSEMTVTILTETEEIYYLETSFNLDNYAKIDTTWPWHVFFVIADRKFFTWCNVIQQIKSPCLNTHSVQLVNISLSVH